MGSFTYSASDELTRQIADALGIARDRITSMKIVMEYDNVIEIIVSTWEGTDRYRIKS